MLLDQAIFATFALPIFIYLLLLFLNFIK